MAQGAARRARPTSPPRAGGSTSSTASCGIQLPVYVLVTKCDLVAGFTEYFDDLTQEGRAQVWGVTFPYDADAQGRGGRGVSRRVRCARSTGSTSACSRGSRRSATSAGGARSSASRSRWRRCATRWPSSSPTSSRRRASTSTILLRGVYFTSGTQEGTPIDRLLGAIGRRLRWRRRRWSPPGGRGKAYFIERLLKDVLFAESGLAGVNRRLEVQKAAVQLAAYAAMAAIAVLGVIALSISYSRNRTYLGRVSEAVTGLQASRSVPPTAPRADLVGRLDAVQAVADLAREPYSPIYMRWGLYQGGSVGGAAQAAYFRELNNSLVPRVKVGIEQRMGVVEAEDLYEYLKGYLMLGETHASRLDEDPLAALAWDEDGAGDSLSGHFLRLLEDKSRLRPLTLNDSLVRQAQSEIRNASIPQIVYGGVVRFYDGDDGLRLDEQSGVGAARVLRFKSGRRLNEPLSRLYTKPVFKEVTAPDALKEAVTKYHVRAVGVGRGRRTGRVVRGGARRGHRHLRERLHREVGCDRQRHRCGVDAEHDVAQG